MKRRDLLITGAVLAVAVIGFVAIAPSTDESEPDRYRWLSREPAVREAERLWGEAQDAQRRAEGEWEMVHSIALASQLAPSRAPLTFVAHRAVPAARGRAYETTARREFAALGADTKLPVTVLVVMDSLRTRFGYRRVVIVPQSAADPCVVVLRVEVRTAPIYGTSPSDELLGTCAFYAKFGIPGAGMQAWLDRTRARPAVGWTPAEESHSDRPPEKIDQRAVMRAPVVAACVAGRPNTCTRLFDAEPFEFRFDWQMVDASVDATTGTPRAWSFSPWEARWVSGDQLASLRTEIGEERFAAIWQSADEPAAAFQRSEGYPIDELIRRRLAKDVLPYHPGPMVRALPLLLALLLTAGLAWWALARSERVMS